MIELTKSNRPPRKATSQIWLIVYSDLITNLTLFFLLLYAFSRLTANQQTEMMSVISQSMAEDGTAVVKANQALQKFQQQDTISKFDQLKSLGNYAKFDISEQMMKITLNAPVLFNSGDSEIKNEAIPILDEIAGLLSNIPNDVVIEGHTDNVPISTGKYSSNWELSSARANNVIDYFVGTRKMNSERFISAGYGEFHPVAPNDTPENRSLNRRIEINIIR